MKQNFIFLNELSQSQESNEFSDLILARSNIYDFVMMSDVIFTSFQSDPVIVEFPENWLKVNDENFHVVNRFKL